MCGISTSGDTWCWGNDSDGELGSGGTSSVATLPVMVTGGHHFTQVAVGGHRSCGVEAGGAVYCWGKHFAAYAAPAQALCEIDQHGCDPTPVALAGGLSLHGLTLGSESACGLDGHGAAYCWGTNFSGEMGTGGTSRTEVSAPVAVATSERFAQIDASAGNTCAVTTDHRPFCWGANDMAQIGDGTTVARYVPTPVAGGYRFKSISAGNLTTCGLTVSTVYCWGDGAIGQLGNGTLTWDSPFPVQVNDHP
jgi:alpha-tubulin suppressor-like RCC1 family protein